MKDMERLKSDIGIVVNFELERARTEHGKVNCSDHESYAIIKEEIEEFEESYKLALKYFDGFWNFVKCDAGQNEKLEDLTLMNENMMNAAAELMQVMAMINKAIVTIQERNDEKSDEFFYEKINKDVLSRIKEIKTLNINVVGAILNNAVREAIKLDKEKQQAIKEKEQAMKEKEGSNT